MTRQGALRVLVVEDEFLIALTMERMLHRFGVEVVGPIGSWRRLSRLPVPPSWTVPCWT